MIKKIHCINDFANSLLLICVYGLVAFFSFFENDSSPFNLFSLNVISQIIIIFNFCMTSKSEGLIKDKKRLTKLFLFEAIDIIYFKLCKNHSNVNIVAFFVVVILVIVITCLLGYLTDNKKDCDCWFKKTLVGTHMLFMIVFYVSFVFLPEVSNRLTLVAFSVLMTLVMLIEVYTFYQKINLLVVKVEWWRSLIDITCMLTYILITAISLLYFPNSDPAVALLLFLPQIYMLKSFQKANGF